MKGLYKLRNVPRIFDLRRSKSSFLDHPLLISPPALPLPLSWSSRHDPLYLSRAAIKIVLKARELLSMGGEGEIAPGSCRIETARFVLRFAPFPGNIGGFTNVFSDRYGRECDPQVPIVVEVVLFNSIFMSLFSMSSVTTWIVDVWQTVSKLERNRRRIYHARATSAR